MRKINLLVPIISTTFAWLPIISCAKQNNERTFALVDFYKQYADITIEIVPKGVVVTFTSKDNLKYVPGIDKIIVGSYVLQQDEYIFDVETSKLLILNEALNKDSGNVNIWPQPLKWIPGITKELMIETEFDLKPMVSDVMKSSNLIVKPIYTDDTIGQPLVWNSDYKIYDSKTEIVSFDTIGYEFDKSGSQIFTIELVANPAITYELELDIRQIPDPTLNYLTFEAIDDNSCAVSINPSAAIEQTTDISIPSTATISGKTYNVTEIKANGFQYLKFNSIYISASIERINAEAFDNCSISEIRFAKESKLNYIGYKSFANIKNCLNISIPASCAYIDDYAFLYAELNKLSFEENSKITLIGKMAFCNSKLQNVILPSSLQKIAAGAFNTNKYNENCKVTFSDSSTNWVACTYGKQVKWKPSTPEQNAFDLMSEKSEYFDYNFLIDKPINVVPTSFDQLEWDPSNPTTMIRGANELKLKFKALEDISASTYNLTLYSDEKDAYQEYLAISYPIAVPETSKGSTVEITFGIWLDASKALYVFPQIANV